MNILIIPTNDWVRAPGHGHINYIAESLAEKGHKIYAWNFDLYKNEPVRRVPKKVVLVKSKTLPFRDAALFFTFNALFQAPSMFKAIRKFKINVIINENIFSGLISFLVSGNSVLKVFDYSDYFPESASIYYEKSSPTVRKAVEAVTLAINNLNIKAAHICLSVCQSFINNVRSIDSQKPCFFLSNSVDVVKHTRHMSLSNQLNLEQTDGNLSPTLIVMGVIDYWLDLITPLKAVKILSVKFPGIKFVIIGSWRNQEFKKSIESFIEKEELEDNVKITGYVSDDELVRYLDKASCCIMPYRTDFYSAVIRLPEKLFVYSAHGKPILSTPLPEVMSLHNEHVLFFHDAEELAKTASILLTDYDKWLRLSHKAKQFAQNHDVNILAEKLEKILLANLKNS